MQTRYIANLARGLTLLIAIVGPFVVAHAAVKYKVLHDFTNGPDGDGNGGVTVDAKGNVYGATLTGKYNNGLIFELTPSSDGKWSEMFLYSFPGGDGGESPQGKPLFDAAGNLYGVTEYGGKHKWGTVFRLTPSAKGWTHTILYNFCSAADCDDGEEPQSGVIMDSDGNLYGAAYAVFELRPQPDGWKETSLHNFTGNHSDGKDAISAVVRDSVGNLYGMTYLGGLQCGSSTCGTIYEISPQPDGKWKETILLRFNGKNGQFPLGALLLDGSGALYGTAELGGTGGGVVFKMTPTGNGHWDYAIIHDFSGGTEGDIPVSGVVMDTNGNLYGTTGDGGNISGCGVLYKMSPSAKGKWRYTVLHRFGKINDGCAPAGDLTIDSSGNLYGGTLLGGSHGFGTVYELTPDPSPSPQ
ncbi:MAG TPA: choice-of-anchor tandem repeat GloVer-containing protein [Terriglobales bacterium]